MPLRERPQALLLAAVMTNGCVVSDKNDDEPGGSATDDGSSDDGSSDDGSSGGGSSGEPLGEEEEIELYRANCEAQTNREACEAVEPRAFPMGINASCVWFAWVPTTYDPETQTCEFGEEQGECAYDYAPSSGCESGEQEEACLSPDQKALRKQQDGVTLLAKASPCHSVDPCTFAGGSWNDPACNCLCDEAYPD